MRSISKLNLQYVHEFYTLQSALVFIGHRMKKYVSAKASKLYFSNPRRNRVLGIFWKDKELEDCLIVYSKVYEKYKYYKVIKQDGQDTGNDV